MSRLRFSLLVAPAVLFSLFFASQSLAVTLNPGDIIVSQGYDVRIGTIFRVDPVTGAQEVISSGGLLNEPTGVAIDSAGNIITVNRWPAFGWGGHHKG